MNPVFIETSALLRLIFQEAEGNLVSARLRTASRIVASRLIWVETERALIRYSLGRHHAAQLALFKYELKSFWPKVDFIEISAEICEIAGRIAPTANLRSLDAIHLATYLRLKESHPTLEMLTFDHRIKTEL